MFVCALVSAATTGDEELPGVANMKSQRGSDNGKGDGKNRGEDGGRDVRRAVLWFSFLFSFFGLLSRLPVLSFSPCLVFASSRHESAAADAAD